MFSMFSGSFNYHVVESPDFTWELYADENEDIEFNPKIPYNYATFLFYLWPKEAVWNILMWKKNLKTSPIVADYVEFVKMRKYRFLNKRDIKLLSKVMKEIKNKGREISEAEEIV